MSDAYFKQLETIIADKHGNQGLAISCDGMGFSIQTTNGESVYIPIEYLPQLSGIIDFCSGYFVFSNDGQTIVD